MGIKEFKDGQVIITYDAKTLELESIEDCHGNDLTHGHWLDVALEYLAELNQERLDAIRKDF